MARSRPARAGSIQMTEGSLYKNILLFSVPLIFSQLLQVLFNMADVAVVGKFSSSTALGSVGSTSTLVTLFTGFLIGLSNGVNVRVAQYLGARQEEDTRNCVHTALILCTLSGVVIAVLCFFLAAPMLELLRTKDDLLPGAVLYFRIYALGMPALGIFNFGNAVLSASGDTKRPLICLTVSGVLNAGLNIFLVAVCGMDVDGVAIATVLSNVVSCVVVVWMLCREKSEIRLSLRALRMDRALLGRMLAIGLPAGLQSTVFTFSNVCIQSTLNSFGTAAMAGSSAALNYEFFAYFPVVAFGQAAVTFSSQNFGAGQYDRCRKIFRQTMLLSLVCAEVMGLGFVFGKELFVRFFTAEADVAEFAYIRMCTLLPFYFLVPLYEVGGAALRGIGHSLAPAVLTVLGTCVLRLIWVFTVCRIWPDYRVLMLVYPITWALTGAAIMVCYFLVDRKLAKKFLTAQTH